MSDSLRSRGQQHVLHYLLKFAQTHVHRVGDAMQSSYPLSSPSPALDLSHIGIFSNELTLHIRWPKYWNFSISPSNEYSWLVSFRIDWFDLLAVSPRDSQECSPAPQFKNINSSVFNLLYGPTLISIHDYWKNYSFDYTDLCQQSGVSAF